MWQAKNTPRRNKLRRDAKISEEDVHWAAEMIQRRQSLHTVGRVLGVSAVAVWQRLRRDGLPTRRILK